MLSLRSSYFSLLQNMYSIINTIQIYLELKIKYICIKNQIQIYLIFKSKYICSLDLKRKNIKELGEPPNINIFQRYFAQCFYSKWRDLHGKPVKISKADFLVALHWGYGVKAH